MALAAVVELSQEAACDKERLWDLRSHFFRVNGHSEADAVQRGPADGKDHERRERG